MTLSQGGQLSFLGPLLVGANLCIPRTSEAYCFADVLTQLFRPHTLALVRVTQILILAHSSCLQHSSTEKCPNPLTGAIITRQSMLDALPVSGFNVCWLISV